jgi:prolyl oligopeptidase
MMRFHKFTIGHFWCSDFGNAEEGGYDYMIKYSPLHTVKQQLYPATLVLTADHDDRVVPLHTYKYVAELQYQAGAVEGQRPLLARIDVNAGHGGGKPTAMVIKENADCYAFIAKANECSWTD